MQSISSLNVSAVVPDAVAKLAYQSFQWGKNYFGLAHKTLSARLLGLLYPPTEQKTKPVSPAVLEVTQQRFDQLLEADWQDAEQGIYPQSLLFDNAWEEFIQHYPALWLDLPKMGERVQKKRYQDFAEHIEVQGYPDYYVQNFHHQTDGYLSDRSADLYDLQVDLLFGGTADAMRRRILAPLKAALQRLSTVPASQIRILDVACGTGRTLKLLRAAFPKVSLVGIDLSPAYLRKANQRLAQIPGELPQLVQGNAEHLPFIDNHFQAVTSVFLFHELPAAVRQQVINECFRVVQPGGVCVLCDSIQISDSPQLQPMMENFPILFHEPYYRHYITDDLGARLEQAGFVKVETQVHLVSKYWIAHKPV